MLFQLATQPLPELSTQVQAALDAAGLTDVTARAEVYGEIRILYPLLIEPQSTFQAEHFLLTRF